MQKGDAGFIPGALGEARNEQRKKDSPKIIIFPKKAVRIMGGLSLTRRTLGIV